MPPERSRRLAVALLSLLATAPGLVQGQAPDPGVPGATPDIPTLTPAWLDLVVNEVPKGSVLVQVAGADVWAAADDLAGAGLKVDGGERIARSGRSYVSLRSLGPGLAFVLDEEALTLRLSATRATLGRTRLDLAPMPRPPGWRRREAPSAFLNLAARADSAETRVATGELGASMGPALLLAGATLDDRQGFVRGLTTAYWDDVPRLARYAAGDVAVQPGDPLGGSALLMGGSAGREFSLDPYFVRAPYPRSSLFVPLPSTLEVYVNDSLVRRQQVLPGTIDLENLPAQGGLSEIRTVVRDAFGREASASTFALMGSTLLTPGLVDWGAAVGARRESYGAESLALGPMVGVGRVRVGLHRLLTVGGRIEASRAMASGGAQAGVATPLGEFDVAAAASVDEDRTGGAGYVAFRRTGRWGGLAAQVRLQSDRYATTSLGSVTDRAVLRAIGMGSIALSRRVTVFGDVTAERWRDAEDVLRGALRLLWSPGAGHQFTFGGARTYPSGSGEDWEVFASFSMLLGQGTTGEVRAVTGATGESGLLTLQRGLRQGTDFGYRLSARGGEGSVASADVQGQSGVGRAQLFHQTTDPLDAARDSFTSGEVATGLVLIDGGLHVTRPVDGSYALVRLDGAAGVRTYRDGQEVGRTDGEGRILVPGLLPYFGNRLSIRDSDVPLDFRVNEVERVIAPRYRGGTVERFDVARLHAVTGRLKLQLDGRTVVPEWGEVAVELQRERAVSPVGNGGLFWFEGIPAGRHEALLRWEGRLCRFTFEVADVGGTTDLGEVRCSQMLALGRD